MAACVTNTFSNFFALKVVADTKNGGAEIVGGRGASAEVARIDRSIARVERQIETEGRWAERETTTTDGTEGKETHQIPETTMPFSPAMTTPPSGRSAAFRTLPVICEISFSLSSPSMKYVTSNRAGVSPTGTFDSVGARISSQRNIVNMENCDFVATTLAEWPPLEYITFPRPTNESRVFDGVSSSSSSSL